LRNRRRSKRTAHQVEFLERLGQDAGQGLDARVADQRVVVDAQVPQLAAAAVPQPRRDAARADRAEAVAAEEDGAEAAAGGLPRQRGAEGARAVVADAPVVEVQVVRAGGHRRADLRHDRLVRRRSRHPADHRARLADGRKLHLQAEGLAARRRRGRRRLLLGRRAALLNLGVRDAVVLAPFADHVAVRQRRRLRLRLRLELLGRLGRGGRLHLAGLMPRFRARLAWRPRRAAHGALLPVD